MTWFLCCVPSWFLSRPFELILSFCTQLTTLNTISPHFCIVYPTDSFQDHLTQFYQCTHLTPFKTIWPKFHWKALCFSLTALFTENHCAFHWKATKTSDSTQISHYDLVFHRVQRECQLCIYYILVVFGGACMCKWCMYTHILTWFCLFSWKVALFIKSTWKALKSTWKVTKTADSTQISHFDLVFHRVQREGQLGISYILVVFGGACGACMCKWCMYTHILTQFCLFS